MEPAGDYLQLHGPQRLCTSSKIHPDNVFPILRLNNEPRRVWIKRVSHHPHIRDVVIGAPRVQRTQQLVYPAPPAGFIPSGSTSCCICVLCSLTFLPLWLCLHAGSPVLCWNTWPCQPPPHSHCFSSLWLIVTHDPSANSSKPIQTSGVPHTNGPSHAPTMRNCQIIPRYNLSNVWNKHGPNFRSVNTYSGRFKQMNCMRVL